MARKSFFERMEREIDFQKEYEKIEHVILNEYEYVGHTIENEIEKYFREWEDRQNYMSFYELRKELGFTYYTTRNYKESNVPNGFITCIEDFLLYCEMIRNLLKHTYIKSPYNEQRILDINRTIQFDLDRINHQFYVYGDGREIVVQKNAATSAVADIVEPILADEIVRYNHYLLKGDLESKKDILIKIAAALEPMRQNLRDANKTIENDLFFLVNRMNIRHNNCDSRDSKNYCEEFDKLSKSEKESWYDEIYQESLMAFLTLEQKKRERKIAEFKQRISNNG